MMVSQFVSTLLLASAEGGSTNPLEWKTDLALWTLVVFGIMLAILWRFAWGPIVQGLDKREQTVADQIAGAEAANQKARDNLAEYERKLAAAGDEVRAILDQGRRDADQIGRDMLEKAKEDAAAEHAQAVKQIEAATDAAIKSLADRSAAMAVDLAGKIVSARLNPADHARLIEQAVGGFAAGGTDVSRN